jgi:hypothetical protein
MLAMRNTVQFFKREYYSFVRSIILHKVGVNFDDANYKKYFENTIGPSICQTQPNGYFISCAFCSKLEKSSCHDYCFRCSNGTYKTCSILIPGTYPFTDSYLNLIEEELTPWIFKTPCMDFERLDNQKYFKNFVSNELSATVACYETLEGLFTGLIREKKPCHLCASVHIDIYNTCSQENLMQEDKPCTKIIHAMAKNYHTNLASMRQVK